MVTSPAGIPHFPPQPALQQGAAAVVKHRKTRRARRKGRTGVLLRAAVVVLALGLIGFALLTGGSDGSRSAEEMTVPEPRSDRKTTAVVATDALNLRNGASLDAVVIDTLPMGSELEVLGAPRNGFTPVRFGTVEAWMATAFLDVPGSAPAVEPSVPDQRPGVPEEPRAIETNPLENPLAVPVQEPPQVEVDDASITEQIIPDVPVQASTDSERWIDVDRTTGIVTLHEGGTVVATYQGKIGRDPSPDGFYSTAVGTFRVYSMNRELAETPFAEGVYLTDWVGFDPERSNGFHSPVRDEWGNVHPVQSPTTLGCVRLDADAAAAVFAFSFIGMRVEIHD